MIGPATSSRKDDATRYHLAHSADTFLAPNEAMHSFYFEESGMLETPSARGVLIRVTIAKVVDVEQTRKVLRSLSPRREDESYSCLTWVREAFVALHAEPGCLESYFDESKWRAVEECARRYCKQKREERRSIDDGTLWESTGISTFNAWENRETTA